MLQLCSWWWVQIAPETCRANDERNKEYSVHLVGPELNILVYKTHVMFNNFFPLNCGVYEIMWGKCGWARQTTDENVMQRMLISCWKPKATDMHSEYIILFAVAQQHRNAPQLYVVRTLPVLYLQFPAVTSRFRNTERDGRTDRPIDGWCEW
jgi:hypothetical protein